MPYAPGIQNISGELLAQGMRERSQGVAGGLVNWIKGYEQNQSLKNQSMATFSGLMNSDPEFKQHVSDIASGNVNVPQPLKKAIGNLEKGELDVYDASLVGNYAQIYQTGKARRDEQQRSKLQQAAVMADVLGKMPDIDYGVQQGYISPELANSLKQMLGTSGVTAAPSAARTTPSAAAAPAGSVASPAALEAAVPSGQALSLEQMGGGMTGAGAAAAGMGAPAKAARFLGGGQSPTQAAVPTAAIRAVAPSVMPQVASDQAQAGAVPSGGLRQEAGWDPNKPFSLNNQLGFIDAAAIRQELYPRGVPPSQEAKANAVVAAEYDKRMKLRQQAFEARDVQPSAEMPSENGLEMIVKDKRTNQVIGRRPNPNHPEVARQIKFNETIATESGKSIVARLDKIRNDAIAAAEDAPRVDQILDFLSEGVKTGPLTPLQTQLLSAAANAGLLSKDQVESVSKQEQLQTLLAKEAFAMAQKASGQGSISNNERKELSMQVANATKLGQTNYPLMLMVKGIQEKAHAAEELRSQLKAAGKNEAEIDDAITSWAIDPKNSYRNFIPKERLQSGPGITPTPAPAPAPGAKPQFRWDPATQKLIPL